MSRKFVFSVMACLAVGFVAAPWVYADRISTESAVGLSRPIVTLVPAGRMKDRYLVDAYAYGATDLRSYQVTITTSGGRGGHLMLSGAVVNRQRADFVFGDADVITAESLFSARLAVVSDFGIDVPEWLYLGTFVFQPSDDARGEFRIAVSLQHENRTILANTNNGEIDFVAGPDARILVEPRPNPRAPSKTDPK